MPSTGEQSQLLFSAFRHQILDIVEDRLPFFWRKLEEIEAA
jgi:hypothetical protein